MQQIEDQQESYQLMINDHDVKLTFARENNPIGFERVKEILLASCKIEKRSRMCPSDKLPDVDQAWKIFQDYYNTAEGEDLSLYPIEDTIIYDSLPELHPDVVSTYSKPHIVFNG